MRYEYKAIQTRQSTSDKMIALFAAPAVDIDHWAGVPQKKTFGTAQETVGFQREENSKRVSSLGQFCENQENIIQNPLLCATRQCAIATIRFEPSAGEQGETQVGVLIIDIPDYDSFTMQEVLELVRSYLEERVPECKAMTVDASMVARLKADAIVLGHVPLESNEEAEEAINENSEETNGSEVQSALFDESHILDFWQEVAARHEVIKQIETSIPTNEFLGFSREALISYLRPVVLVDGQHRLRGTLRAGETILQSEHVREEIENRIISGESPQEVQEELVARMGRRLPISLLLADDPAEQVFQFVIVNQKATPIGRALLGTIVSTTLSNAELESVASRLKTAGIELEESKAITYLARAPESPFCGLIERGMAGDAQDLMQWGVFASLVSIFRDLKGGRLFGYRNDYAEKWKGSYLQASAVVAQHKDEGYETPLEYWRSLDGPWRPTFIAFFSAIRDKFGNSTDVEAHNFWGNPRNSNLFNKVSLTILTADFFQYLVERRATLESVPSVQEIVDEWLQDVSGSYFNRDWNLAGTKKDSTGIRDQWAYQWAEYRKSPSQLPQSRLYRLSRGG